MSRLRAAAGRLRLRTRLAALVVALVAVGLTVAGVVTYRALESFLIDQVDRQLAAGIEPASAELGRALGFGRPGPDTGFGGPRGRRPALPQGSYVELRGSRGDTITSASFGLGGSAPALPDRLPGRPFTAPSPSGDVRVLATRSPRLPGEVVLAIPLAGVEETLGRLVVVEVVVALVALFVIGGLALWLVGVELRPLGRIATTAGQIADGDLSRRVADANPHTEVGRLGGALNVMLGRIEQAFAERRASEERLRRFVADASHELRTPLASVRGYAELFRRGAASRPRDLALAMRRIEQESARMGVLVDDLLLLARLDQGRPLARVRVRLAPLVADAVADARAADPGRPVTVHIADHTLTVTGDEGRLRQVLGNLLANARVHTPAGTAVSVSLAREDGSAAIRVADEGPGLAAADAARVFERFFRADASRARESGGTGLGLSIVASVVRAHAGTVTMDSAPGEGTRVTVRLPLATGAGAPVAAADG